MFICVGAEVSVLVVPQRIESVNGSDVDMGCTSPLVDSGGVMVCNSTDCPSSYLLDSNSPAIDISTSDWASQLVTVRKNSGAAGLITFDHVVLTFGFDTAVSLTSIELDLFLCPEWNISAPFIAVFGDENRDLVLRMLHILAAEDIMTLPNHHVTLYQLSVFPFMMMLQLRLTSHGILS